VLATPLAVATGDGATATVGDATSTGVSVLTIGTVGLGAAVSVGAAVGGTAVAVGKAVGAGVGVGVGTTLWLISQPPISTAATSARGTSLLETE
jgi:hypothetical protein